MSVEEFGRWYGEIYEKVAREGLTANGVVMAIYHDQEFDPAYSDIEVAVGVRERDKAELIMPAPLFRLARRLRGGGFLDGRQRMADGRAAL